MGYKNKRIHDYDECDYCEIIIDYMHKRIAHQKELLINDEKIQIENKNFPVFGFEFLWNIEELKISPKTLRLHINTLIKENKIFVIKKGNTFSNTAYSLIPTISLVSITTKTSTS